MCGICGKVAFDERATVNPALIGRMLRTIVHRGPDGEGIHVSGPVGLGHRRLAIIDLNTGQQPLSNEDGTVWITFNGEIYNYQELRRELIASGHVFRTKSDTEVIVHLYEERGAACVEKLRGMFAFASGTSGTRRWSWRATGLASSRSIMRTRTVSWYSARRSRRFWPIPEVDRQILPEMIDRFLTFQYLPGEDTLFRGIRKLAPGSYMVVREGRVKISNTGISTSRPQRAVSEDAAAEDCLALLEESVRMHMISDVPVGFLLSGGVDSTAVLGLAVGKTDKPLSSYTLGIFSKPGITDERPYARLAAQTYGSEHHELTITREGVRRTSCRSMSGTWRSRFASRRPSRCSTYRGWPRIT